MNRLLIKIVSFLTVIGISGCTGSSFLDRPEYYLKEKFSPETKVAVLTFERNGQSAIKNSGSYVADRISDKLFIDKKIQVIDRSLVNRSSLRLNIKNTEYLTADLIQTIGNDLSVDFLVCGKIETFPTSMYFDPEAENTIHLTLRVISAKTGELVGLAQFKKTDKDGIESYDRIINTVIDPIDWLKEPETENKISVPVDTTAKLSPPVKG